MIEGWPFWRMSENTFTLEIRSVVQGLEAAMNWVKGPNQEKH